LAPELLLISFVFICGFGYKATFFRVSRTKKKTGISESDRYYDVSFNWISANSSEAKKGLMLRSKAWRYIVFCVGIKRKNLPPVQGDYFSLF